MSFSIICALSLPCIAHLQLCIFFKLILGTNSWYLENCILFYCTCTSSACQNAATARSFWRWAWIFPLHRIILETGMRKYWKIRAQGVVEVPQFEGIRLAHVPLQMGCNPLCPSTFASILTKGSLQSTPQCECCPHGHIFCRDEVVQVFCHLCVHPLLLPLFAWLLTSIFCLFFIGFVFSYSFFCLFRTAVRNGRFCLFH